MSHKNKDKIKCPHCDYEIEESAKLNDYNNCKIKCLDCDKDFVLNIAVKYSTLTPELWRCDVALNHNAVA